MSEISEAAKAKAASLSMNEPGWPLELEMTPADFGPGGIAHAFARFIQQVSDVAKLIERWTADGHMVTWNGTLRDAIAPFILPDPVDPLEEIFAETFAGIHTASSRTLLLGDFKHRLAKRGLEIREVQP